MTLCHRLHEFYFYLKILKQVEYSKGEPRGPKRGPKGVQMGLKGVQLGTKGDQSGLKKC